MTCKESCIIAEHPVASRFGLRLGALRHCERSEAILRSLRDLLDGCGPFKLTHYLLDGFVALLYRNDGSPAAPSEWISAFVGMAYGSLMRPALLLAPLLLLAACEPEPENIQARAETLSRELEERANQIRAEAENGVEAQAAPLENEADALLNRIAGDTPANGAGEPANAQ